MTRSRNFIGQTALVVLSCLVGLVVLEIGLRLFYPISIMNVERPEKNDNSYFVRDEILGLYPAPGKSGFDVTGVSSRRPAKTTPSRTVLCIGDSVTAFGRISAGLADTVSPDITLLNGGVAGYNIQQEIEYFFRFQKDTHPQVVIHQMHVNDLRASRWVVRDKTDGTVKIYSPRNNPQNVNMWLYSHSHLYRFYVANLQSRNTEDELESAALESLRKMRDYTRANGIDYYVYLFPILEPYSQWSQFDKSSREHLLEMSKQLGLGTVDLLPVAERMIAD